MTAVHILSVIHWNIESEDKYPTDNTLTDKNLPYPVTKSRYIGTEYIKDILLISHKLTTATQSLPIC